MIELINVTKRYKDRLVIDRVNVTFPNTGCVAITGINGSGKSVLLKLICGFAKPNTGTIKIDGKEYTSKKEYIKDAGIIINAPDFIDYLTIYENLIEVSKILNLEGTSEKINQLLKYFDLETNKNTKYKSCSQGMKQKMRLIQALMEDHPIYILDELTNALDKKSVEKVRDKINLLKKEKLILITSHNEGDIEHMADISYELIDGRLEKI